MLAHGFFHREGEIMKKQLLRLNVNHDGVEYKKGSVAPEKHAKLFAEKGFLESGVVESKDADGEMQNDGDLRELVDGQVQGGVVEATKVHDLTMHDEDAERAEAAKRDPKKAEKKDVRK